MSAATGPKLLEELIYARNTGNGATLSSSGDIVLQCEGSSFADNGGQGLKIASGPSLTVKGSTVMINRTLFQGNGSHGCDVDCSASTNRGSVVLGPGVQCVGNPGRGDALRNLVGDCSTGACNENGLEGMTVEGGAKLTFHQWTWIRNGSSGIRVQDSDASFGNCVSASNGGDGIECSSSLVGSSVSVSVSRSTCSDILRRGIAFFEVHHDLDHVDCSRNTLGGYRSISSVCIPVGGRLTSCAMRSNGGVAVDFQNAAGGEVSQCTVSGSSTGIYIGDPNGGGCCTGVRVSNNAVAGCGTGIEVLSGGGHLVVCNSVLTSTTAYALGAGNVLGPIVTSADIASNTNPSCNYAP